MKKLVTLLFVVILFSLTFTSLAQTSPDYIFGSDNGALWNWTTGTAGTASLGGSYSWQFTATATTGHYVKFGETSSSTDGSGFWVNSSAPDMNYTGAGAKWTAYYQANMGSGGAIYWAITTGNYYVVKTKLSGSNADFAVFDNGTQAPVTISSVARTISGTNLTVTATASAVVSTNEKVWVRYSTDNWTSSATTELTFVSATNYAAALALADGNFVSYYVYTTIQQAAAPAEADADFYTINYNSNGGVNYTAQIGNFSGDYYIPQSGNAKGFDKLSTAVTNLNSNGMSANVNFYITGDITEAANIGLGVNTNGFGITIRPNADADRTITFTKTTDNTSPSGHFVIGYTVLTSAWADANTIATSNVTIDGYAVAGSTRRLKFTTASGSLVASRLIMVIGGCQNTVVKNCIVESKSTAASAVCIGTIARKGTAIEVAPLNFTIENNIITSVASPSGEGLMTSNSGTLTTAKTTGLVVKNNTISAQGRGGWFYYINGGDFDGNEIKLNQLGSANTVNFGLWTSIGAIGTFNIHNNRFTEITTLEATATGSLGTRALSLGSGPTYNIYNNTFAGMDRKSVAAAQVNQTYVFLAGIGTIYNNTFYMPALTVPATPGYYRAINLFSANPDIKNNIFISNEDAMTNEFFGTVTTGASDYNVFYLRAGNTKARIVGTYTTLAEYQAANVTKDVHSKNVNVTFTSVTDLHLAGASLGDVNLIGETGLGIATDIDGQTRSVTFPYMGADEDLANLLPVELTSFNSTVRGKEVNLTWKTATEINSYGFEIQKSEVRSQNGGWEKVGFVQASGNSNSPREYTFTDNNLQEGKYQYRLKMIDNDGTFEYSNIIEAEITAPKEFVLSQNYPNPFNPVTTINYSLPIDGKVMLVVYSINGEKIAELVNETQAAGSYNIPFSATGLASGTYIYRLQAGEFVQMKKMILLK
ncbi:MAG: T9SS type A sorting domain-containing protein [Ignavibacteriaceae bacterium]|jgi:hypothetical protein